MSRRVLPFVYGLVVLLVFLRVTTQNCLAQNKLVVDTNAIKSFPFPAGGPKLSSDGNYSMYITSVGAGTSISIGQSLYNLHVTANYTDWSLEVKNISSSYEFSNNSRFAYFLKGDSLGRLDVTSKQILYITGVQSFKITKNRDWIAYQQNGKLILHNIIDARTFPFGRTDSYIFSSNGKVLLTRTDDSRGTSFTWTSLRDVKSHQFWNGSKIGTFTFSPNADELAFTAVDSELSTSEKKYAIYLYKDGATQAENILNNGLLDKNGKFVVSNRALMFSNKGDKLLFQIDSVGPTKTNPLQIASPVVVWSYKDHYTQSVQADYPQQLKTNFYAILNTYSKRVVRLNFEGERVNVPDNRRGFENYICVDGNLLWGNDLYLYYQYGVPYYLVSTTDGHRIKFVTDYNNNAIFHELSPDEKYLVWFDPKNQSYFSYTTTTGNTQNISITVPDTLFNVKNMAEGKRNLYFDIAAWGKSDGQLFLNSIDGGIWQIDLKNVIPAKKITSEVSRNNKLWFSFSKATGGVTAMVDRLKPLLLKSINIETKEEGFWKVDTNINSHIINLYSGPYLTEILSNNLSEYPNNLVYGNQTFIVIRQRANFFPNLYFTKDLISFKNLTNYQPQQAYNWVTDELINWKLPNGKSSQGVLYKPENFDPHKKYPIIFLFYNIKSDKLNVFPRPGWTNGEINIPYFVSNGYLVFTPDIHYQYGKNGESAVNAVVSAAHYLAKLSFVDSNKIGINGHSFGGFETNYIVTHSHVFAAACSAAGISDETTSYYREDGINGDSFVEYSLEGAPYGSNVTPYTKPELYVENSSVLSVNNATTPLLLAHGDNDKAVLFSQATEMYYAMRRAGKKVWLLEYKNAGHTLFGDDAKDFTVRVKQFFDYYLKNEQPPLWMTKGILYARKDYDNGLELDNTGTKP